MKSMRQYAAKVGADFSEIKTPRRPHIYNGNPAWECVEILRSFVAQEYYDEILILDCDVVVTPSCPNLFDIAGDMLCVADVDGVGGDRFGGWVSDFFPDSVAASQAACAPYFNAGVLLFRRDAALRLCLDGPYPNRWGFDQDYLNLRVLEAGINVTWLSAAFNYIWKLSEESARPNSFSAIGASQHIVHFVGDSKSRIKDFCEEAFKPVAQKQLTAADITWVWLAYGDHVVIHQHEFSVHNPDVRQMVARSEHDWRNCDRRIREWWRENRDAVTTPYVMFAELDTFVNCDITKTLSAVSGVGFNTIADEKWCWLSETNRLPDYLRPYATGVVPMGTALWHRSAVDVLAQPQYDAVFADDIFCELRSGTVLRHAGVKIERLAGCNIHCGGQLATHTPNIHHPVKQMPYVGSFALSDIPMPRLYSYWEGEQRHWLYDACWDSIVRCNPSATLLGPADVAEIIGPLPDAVRSAYVTHRCDWIRKRVIHELGGAWVDMDFLCLRPLDFLMEQAKHFDYVGYKEWGGGWMDNFFAAKKGSQVLRVAADYALQALERYGRNLPWLKASTEAVTYALDVNPWAIVNQLPTHIVAPFSAAAREAFFAPTTSDKELGSNMLGMMFSMHSLGKYLPDSAKALESHNSRLGTMFRRCRGLPEL